MYANFVSIPNSKCYVHKMSLLLHGTCNLSYFMLSLGLFWLPLFSATSQVWMKILKVRLNLGVFRIWFLSRNWNRLSSQLLLMQMSTKLNAEPKKFSESNKFNENRLKILYCISSSPKDKLLNDALSFGLGLRRTSANRMLIVLKVHCNGLFLFKERQLMMICAQIFARIIKLANLKFVKK